MTSRGGARRALVFGASGLVGRHLVKELTKAGVEVTIAVRSPESASGVHQWLHEHGVGEVDAVVANFDAPLLVPSDAGLAAVTEIYNCAGTYRFGMTAQEARRANVGIVERIVDFAADLPRLQRLVHVSGYRVGGQDPATVPWSDTRRTMLYKRLGPYEASKVESDAVFQARALEHSVPWTIVNPSSVIGDSETGESDQLIGLATNLRQIWDGRAHALPGDASTFLPVVTVDYLAAFMVAAAVDPEAVNQSYWVLDDETPPLPVLLEHLGRHLGVKVPRLRVPARIVTTLPTWVSGAEPETLSFLSADRYPTRTATELAARHDLAMPNVVTSLERWADHLAAHRFGETPGADRRYSRAGGLRTYELGPASASTLILPGLPVNADSWMTVAQALDARVVDLPGLGLTSGAGIENWEHWLPDLVGEGPVDLVGHSIGTAAALHAASRFPERVASLTLVAPFFLQAPARTSFMRRILQRAYLRTVTAERLAQRLTGSSDVARDLESSAVDLRRRTARAVVGHLAAASSEPWRQTLRDQLMAYEGPVRIVTGTRDPLAPDLVQALEAAPNVHLFQLAGAGHHPHLTHPRETAELLDRVRTA